MKLHLERPAGLNAITAIDEISMTVNGVARSQALIVPHAGAITELGDLAFNTLTSKHFDAILALKPEVILFGTGTKQRFAHPHLYAQLTNAGIGLETMTTPAACRTFNILVAEGRRCSAFLLFN